MARGGECAGDSAGGGVSGMLGCLWRSKRAMMVKRRTVPAQAMPYASRIMPLVNAVMEGVTKIQV